MSIKHTPATPLPWTAINWEVNKRTKLRQHALRGPDYPVNLRGLATGPEQRDAAYIAHAANAYPKLVEALALIENSGSFKGGTSIKELQNIARSVLRELGEAPSTERNT